ncbi:hypothetical protein EV361DRAFT_353099 [Lentinula raphanica]|uniref:F-box domain-containing protein n=1 Tax=Lentinula raphanica TaxID=153919 RepID=A0AA38ULN5_9AGAR|nr:hypothetical protein F5880DRAFT_942801 [Lentinula raphanica]KAJ3843227.1 hypothetical protein F5878DRAFT_304901 [Lentinula raphanica]KAJ3976196.1 hypothetical protein EV361DRAFT_353099 [Lentinula raphanica]
MLLPQSVPALDSLLNSLRNQKTDLLHQLEKIDSDIAAAEMKRAKIINDAAFVYRLPPELLSHIFLLCQKDEPAFQLIAARVCSPWRVLAVGTRTLWTDIRISVIEQSHIQPGLDKMETYLSRSGPSSLFAVRLDVVDDLEFAPFMKLIATHISRCAYLSVHASAHEQACSLLGEHLESLRAPHLSYLALHVNWAGGDYDSMMFGTPSIFKAGVPSLNVLQLTGIASVLRPPISGAITTLYLDGVYMMELTVFEYCKILAANHSLVNLSLHRISIDIDHSMSTHSRAVELPMLRSLRIRTNAIEPASNKALLNVLPLSRLESLVLYEVDNLYLSEFPNVKDLSLHRCGFPPNQIDHLLLAFPSVVRLTLESDSLLYMALGMHHEPTMMWPKLRTLCIQGLQHSYAPALLMLVQERSKMNCPLESLYFDSSCHGWAVDTLRAITTLTKFSYTYDYLDPWPPGSDMDSVHRDNFWEG